MGIEEYTGALFAGALTYDTSGANTSHY
jgi:hypothetical protein